VVSSLLSLCKGKKGEGKGRLVPQRKKEETNPTGKKQRESSAGLSYSLTLKWYMRKKKKKGDNGYRRGIAKEGQRVFVQGGKWGMTGTTKKEGGERKKLFWNKEDKSRVETAGKKANANPPNSMPPEKKGKKKGFLRL